MLQGGNVFLEKRSKLCVKGQLKFNSSVYLNGSKHKGNFYLFENSYVQIDGNVTFRQGCKVDCHSNSKLIIGDKSFFNENCRIGTKEKIIIGKNCIFGNNVSIHDFDGHKINGVEGIKSIIIEDNCWIGEGVTILKGVTLGSGTIVGAGSVITKSTPKNSIVAGNPARIVKENVTWSV